MLHTVLLISSIIGKILVVTISTFSQYCVKGYECVRTYNHSYMLECMLVNHGLCLSFEGHVKGSTYPCRAVLGDHTGGVNFFL